MIISSPDRVSRQSANHGFSLVEVMIAMAIGGIVMAAVLTTFVMIGRSGVRVINYSVMETQTRRAFEQLAMDSRMANAFSATFTSGKITSFTLSIPKEDLSGSTIVTYGYDTSDANDKKFFYVPGNNPAATAGRLNLISGLKDLTILRYTSAVTPTLIPAATTSSAGIKHLQVSVSVARSGGNVVEATQVIRSTSFTLRNM